MNMLLNKIFLISIIFTLSACIPNDDNDSAIDTASGTNVGEELGDENNDGATEEHSDEDNSSGLTEPVDNT